VMAERARDGARQYFTRAYDFGVTRLDSVVSRQWPGDTLLREVITIVRAFRPHVIVRLVSPNDDRDATHRFTARLAAAAYEQSGDTARWPSVLTGRVPPWTVGALYTLAADTLSTTTTAAVAPTVQRIDVGAFDRILGMSYAEMGAAIRGLQRTLGAPTVPPVGSLARVLQRDSARGPAGDMRFAALDSTWSRFTSMPDEASAQLDTLRRELDALHAFARAAALAPAARDSLTQQLARVAARTSEVRVALGCRDVAGMPMCEGPLGDFAATLETLRRRATDAVLAQSGLVIDGTVERALVAAGDSVRATVSLYNGGGTPVEIRRIAVFAGSSLAPLARDTAISLPPHQRVQLTGWLRVSSPSYHWWQSDGLQYGTSLHARRPRAGALPQLLAGEHGVRASGVEVTMAWRDTELPVIVSPLHAYSSTTPRGDASHPLAGVPPTTILLDRMSEYVRANVPIDRLVRVFVRSARSTPDTLAVRLRAPEGLTVDSATRTVSLPPFGARSLFFRVRGTMRPGADSIAAAALTLVRRSRELSPGVMTVDPVTEARHGSVTREYPHVPAQQFVRFAKDRVASVDLRIPPGLSVAYLRGASDVRAAVAPLGLTLQLLEPALLSVVTLRPYSAILVGSGALTGESLSAAVPALQRYVEDGGTLILLGGGDDIASSALLPYPLSFDDAPRRVRDTGRPVQLTDARARLLAWPNTIVAADFAGWDGEFASDVPATFDSRYGMMLSMGDAGEERTAGALLTARVGRGTVIYSALSLEGQLDAAVPGAARLLVNMLSAGLPRSAR
jgi:hypothetical protein